MNLDDLVITTGEWLRSTGPEHDVVISSRIRLARNLAGYNFTTRLKPEQRVGIIRMVEEASGKSALLKQHEMVENHKLKQVDNEFLVERRLISRDHAHDIKERAVCFTPNEIISLMV